MNIIFSPQRSSNTRTNFYFDLQKRRILVFYKIGREKNVRSGGEYNSKFLEEHEEKYIVRLDFIEEDTKNTPIRFVTEYSIKEDLNNSSIKLLKQYGPEEENDFSITYPGWNVISGNIDESSIQKRSSLSEFDMLIHTWRKQLSEIITQTYNLCYYLNNEYIAINNEGLPVGSPISIRSFKASILSNTILYIESTANFYTSLAIEINLSCPGAPPKENSLTEREIDKILERNGFLSLERKLHSSINKINKITGSKISIDKGYHWDDFIEIKEKRNSLTHAKIKDHKKHIGVSLDHMISSVKITDLELMKCIETIIWLNKYTDTLFDKISARKGFHDFSFNSHEVLLLLKLISEINEISYIDALEKNGLNDPLLL